jgi:eukaryotic-like serine/threonine-protein kinase
LIGKVVNYRYEVLEKCGDGSFFSVFKARDKVLNRLVAVKVLVPPYSQNPDFAERLISEAQMVADLNHPNISRVFEADAHEGDYFIATEYVRGINLKDRIRRTAPFSVSYAVDIASAVAQALDYAHRNGVIHGDVRPHNILSSPEGQIKLTDFGSARALAAFPTIREATMLRSVHYMAPEVIRGEPAQPASDIYSLGVVLYEMLTGSVPYDGATSASIAAKQLQDPVPSAHARNSGVPALLNEIVMRAMQKDPEKRFASAAELSDALNRVTEWLRTGEAPSAPTVRPEFVAPADDVDLAYEPEMERVESFRKTLVVSLIGVFAVAIVSAILFAFLFGGTHSNEMQVPNLVGQTLDEAKQIANRTGLAVLEHYEYNDAIPEGQIYNTNPRAGGTVPKDKPNVEVWVSRGPRTIIVPDLTGLNADEARRRIADAGFVPGKSASEYNSKIAAEKVIRQSPTAGTKLEPSKTVDIVVSLGPEPTPPDQTGTDTTQPQDRDIPVHVDVPETPDRQRVVRVDAFDVNGTRSDSVTKTVDPGTPVDLTVTGTGDNVEIKVYVDDTKVQDYVVK